MKSLLGEAQHDKALVLQLAIQRLEALVLRRQPALAGRVDHQRDLALPRGERRGLPFQRVRREGPHSVPGASPVAACAPPASAPRRTMTTMPTATTSAPAKIRMTFFKRIPVPRYGACRRVRL
jgi:hypothetical protein